MARLLPDDRPAIWHPVDDALIAGPESLLRDPAELFTPELLENIDAVLGFRGSLGIYRALLVNTPLVVNVTASTITGEHTRKVPVTSVAKAVQVGADAVACHINFTSPAENEMIRTFAQVVEEADRLGMPVVAISYARGVGEGGKDENYLVERSRDPEKFSMRVRHAVRVAVELGASAVKCTYTGSVDSFKTVVASACGVPVLIAGEALDEPEVVFARATEAVEAGARGVAFGRQIFERRERVGFVEELRGRLAKAYANRLG
jgi:DhnA family fructose-bisphosphate aldolase class Ia